MHGDNPVGHHGQAIFWKYDEGYDGQMRICEVAGTTDAAIHSSRTMACVPSVVHWRYHRMMASHPQLLLVLILVLMPVLMLVLLLVLMVALLLAMLVPVVLPVLMLELFELLVST